jgi:acetolactate synthase-1/2/3 large subunit
MKTTGSQVIFRALKQEGVDTIFGYPGGAVMDIYDELSRQDIRHILVRHEQGGVHAADGYARSSGKVGVCLVTSGPGATNAVTGLATAYLDSVPLVVFTGQVATRFIGNDSFQEVDITGITRSCTKHNFLVRDVRHLAATIHQAFHIARSGRPGPVLIDLPKDVVQSLLAEEEVTPTPFPPEDRPDYSYLDDNCRKILQLLALAQRPLLLCGGGVLRGRAAGLFGALAQRLQIPVTATLMGIGAFPASSPLWLGMLGMHGTYYANMAVSNCDLLIAIGARFDDRVTSKVEAFAPHARIVHIDIDPVAIDKVVKSHLPIESDCLPVLKMLLELLDQEKAERTDSYRSWLEQIAAWKVKGPLTYCRSEKIKPQYVIQKLWQLTEGRAIIATDVGQHQMWAAQFYHFDEPNTFLTSGGLGTMGYGLPAAIGAQVANPERLVVNIAGDGSIQMNIQELATAVEYELPVKIVILNNGYLGMVRQWQELYYGKRYSHSGISGRPDFVRLAEAYGALGLAADKSEEVEGVLRRALGHPGVVVMDFRIEPLEGVYPMVKPGAPLTEMALGIQDVNR